MAFVYKAQRRSVTPQRLVTPGPADYVNIEGSVAAQNRAPFLTKVSRMPQTSQPMDNAEYRLYNLAKLALVSERSFKSPLGPVKNSMPVVEHKRPSPHFGSKVERFNKSSNEDCPGPGYYGWDKSLDRRVHVPVLAAEKVPQEKPPRLLPRNKSVPSIPSRTQSHGYTEAHDGNLVQNHQPLEDPSEQYNAKNAKRKETNVRTKPDSWSVAPVKTVESYIPKLGTSEIVGPGSYRGLERESTQSGRPSWNLNSKTDRTCSIKMKRSNSVQRHSYKPFMESFNTFRGEENTGDDDDDDEEEGEEYLKDATPGPGHYYNESTASSFLSRSTSFKSRMSARGINKDTTDYAVKPCVFGGVTDRFKGLYPVNNEVGPGDYNPEDTEAKKDMRSMKVPFQSGNVRFEENKVEDTPGPGAYQLGKDVRLKPRVNIPPNNFAMLSQKINKAKLKSDTTTPGPGDYNPKTLEEMNKDPNEERNGLAVFTSRTKRHSFTPENDTPGVGQYNLHQQNLSTKLMKEEYDWMELAPKRAAFNSSIPRFEAKKIEENDHEDENDEEDEVNWISKKALTRPYQPIVYNKPSAVFSSQTQRNKENKNKTIIPGPGAYNGAKAKSWEKSSFNVNFNAFKD